MAWDWDKGCEVVAQGAPLKSGPWAAPDWGERAAPVAARWIAAEAQCWPRRYMTIERNNEARGLWEECEMAVLWDQQARIPEFRQRYLEWLAREKGVAASIGVDDVTVDGLPLLERIIAVGYRQLAKTAHPDLGGSDAEFNELRTAKGQLDRVLAEVGELLKEEA